MSKIESLKLERSPELIKFTDVRLELKKTTPNARLSKPYKGEEAFDMESVINQCNLPDDLAEKLTPDSKGRIFLHIMRLLRRSQTERNFGLAYLRYQDEISEEYKREKREISRVIGSEGLDTTMFWTFAPYIFKHLTEKGMSDEEAIKKILFWSKDGLSEMNCSRQVNREKRMGRIYLSGLECFNNHDEQSDPGSGNDGNYWILTEDENHISHKFTDQEAKRLVESGII